MEQSDQYTMQVFSVGVTGHRQLEHPLETVKTILRSTLGEMKKAHSGPDSKLQVITGMALGFDMLVAEVCLDLGIPYNAAIPCDGQEVRWSPDQRKRYRGLIEKAQETLVVSPGPYEARKMAVRNQWIVDCSNVIVTYWNGESSSGTGMTVGMARRKNLPVMNLHNAAPVT